MPDQPPEPHSDDMKEMLDRINAVEATPCIRLKAFMCWYSDFLDRLAPIDFDGPFMDDAS